jgi:hypothetical protein
MKISIYFKSDNLLIKNYIVILSIKIINQEICVVQVMNFLQIITFYDCKKYRELCRDGSRYGQIVGRSEE